MRITPYLIFKGECQEAIELYKRAFETEVSDIMRFSDMPQSPDKPVAIPENKKNRILMATMPLGDSLLRLSDTIGELNDAPTDRISIMVECSVDNVKNAFAALAEEGKVGIPLQQSFFSPCYGVVHDKFGVMWVLVALAENQ